MEYNLSASYPNCSECLEQNETLSFLKTNMSELRQFILEGVPLEDKIIYGFLVVLGILIVAANLQVLVLVVKLKFLRKKTNYIIISLAVSDLFSGALAIPLLVVCTSAAEYSLGMCVGMDVCQRFLAISTILHLAMAVMNRYSRIVRPFQYRRVVTAFRLSVLIMSMWFVSLTTALVQITWLHNPQAAQIDLIYDSVVLVVLVVVPFLTIVAACDRTFGAIKQRKYRGKESARSCNLKKSHRKALILYCTMTAWFAIGWFPYFIITITEDLEVEIQIPYWLSIVFLFLKFGTSLADPLLYTFLKSDFQAALKYVFRGENRDSKVLSSQIESQSYLATERITRSPVSPHSKRLISTRIDKLDIMRKIRRPSNLSSV